MHLTYLYQSSRNANARKQITIHAVKVVGLQASLVNNAIANWKKLMHTIYEFRRFRKKPYSIL